MTNLLLALPPLAGGALLRSDPSPIPVGLLAGALALYLWGVARHDRLHPRHRWPRRRTAAFVAAVVVTAFATMSFLDVYDTVLFWVHMTQHLVLIVASGALFAVSSPVSLAWRATTGRAHRALGRALRSRVAEVAGHPAVAFLVYAVVVPVAHLTVFFNWAVEYGQVDDFEHVLFVATGYLFWRQIFGVDPHRARLQPPMRALLLFLALPVDTFVGLTLDLENHEIFPALAAAHRTWGPSLVEDLHLGGVIMWVGGDVLMMLALAPVVAAWFRREQRRAVRADRELEPWYPPLVPGGGQPTAGFALGRYHPKAAPGRRPARTARGGG